MSVKLKDIADRAGVSLYTVSRVLSGRALESRISPERAAEILRIAEECNFRPNSAARAMRTQQSMQVGVLIRNRPSDRYTHPLSFETILGINEGLDEVGYVLSLVRVDDVEVQSSPRSRALRERMLDGIIVIDAMPVNLVARIERLATSVVWAESSVWRDECCIRRDEVDAGRTAAQHLAELGYRKFAWLGLTSQTAQPGAMRNYSLADRLAGVCEVAEKQRIAVEKIELSDKNSEATLPALLKAMNRETAIIAYGVYQARWLQSLAASVGRLPGYHFGLASCDDSHDLHRMWPGLCRVSFDRFDLGLMAARMLIKRITKPKETCPSLVIRGHWRPGNTAWGPASPSEPG